MGSDFTGHVLNICFMTQSSIEIEGVISLYYLQLTILGSQGRNLGVGVLLTDLFSLLPFTTQDCQARNGGTHSCLCFLTSITN